MRYLIIFIWNAFINQSFAGGLDVNNLWSAKYNAMGGAAASNVEGAQSLFFNPAGLSRSRNLELDGNIVTGAVQKSAPLTQGAAPTTSSVAYVPILGFFWSHGVSNKWGWGAGAFVAGGSGGIFGNVDYGSAFPTLKPDLDGRIVLLEFAVGTGYEILPGLSVGAAWRPTYLKLDTKGATPFDTTGDGTPDVLLAPQLVASDILLNSFRLGIQYQPEGEGWGVGASLRTEVEFTSNGTSAGASQLAGSSTVDQIQGGALTVNGKIPMMVALGVHRDFSDRFRLMLQYQFIENSRNQFLNISGDALTVNGVGAIPAAALSTPLKWMDQHVARLGVQYKASDLWTLRAGYVISSPTTRNENASPLFTPPGSENTYAVGGGRPIWLFGNLVNFDFAIEYATVSGVGSNSAPGSIDGNYVSRGIGLDTAISYRW